MTDSNPAALATALAYYRAWTSHDFERAMTYIADDIVCQAPAGRLEGAAAFRGFMGPFAQILTSSKLIAAFGDETTAVVMYDADTVPVKDAPGAECVSVRDGKISHMRIIFDRLPFDAARRAQSPPAG
jgi:ketosteroid isomerase-like protein